MVKKEFVGYATAVRSSLNIIVLLVLITLLVFTFVAVYTCGY